MNGENCTSGCPTRDHRSWAECMRAKHVGHMALGGTTDSYSRQRAFEKETDDLRALVRAGGSISTATNKGFDAAYAEIGGK